MDGNPGSNRRTQRINVLECEGRYRGETTAQTYWYPGFTPANGDDPAEELWQRFGTYIRQHNFLTGDTLNPVSLNLIGSLISRMGGTLFVLIDRVFLSFSDRPESKR